MKKILILGCGAIGSWLAENLANDLKDCEITILDWDVIEDRNIAAHTQNYVYNQVGFPKVEALQLNIHTRSQKEVSIINEKLTKDNALAIMKEYDLVIDCFDNAESRGIVQSFWHEWYTTDLLKHFELLHIGFSDKMTFSIDWGENYQVSEDVNNKRDICELEGAGSFVKMVAALASLTAQDFILNNTKREFVGNGFSIREIK